VIKKNEAGGACGGGHTHTRGAYRVLVEGPERKRPLEKPTFRREDNIEMDLQDVG
jgi:hypothetical protein